MVEVEFGYNTPMLPLNKNETVVLFENSKPFGKRAETFVPNITVSYINLWKQLTKRRQT